MPHVPDAGESPGNSTDRSALNSKRGLLETLSIRTFKPDATQVAAALGTTINTEHNQQGVPGQTLRPSFPCPPVMPPMPTFVPGQGFTNAPRRKPG